MKKLLLLIVLAVMAWSGYDKYKYRIAAAMTPDAAPIAADPTTLVPAATEKFTCDGRTHCSHMRSCAEATYFIQHCPNTKMDGDHDGVPCEQQWCN